MFDFVSHQAGLITFKVDLNIFSSAVIDKVMYHWGEIFYIERCMLSESVQKITLQKKDGDISPLEAKSFAQKLSTDFVDFQLRARVAEETRDIRNILYIKAFSHCDQFEDSDLIS